MTTMSVSPDTPAAYLESPAFWETLLDSSIFIEQVEQGKIQPPEEPAKVCSICGGTGTIDLTPSQHIPWLQDYDDCICQWVGPR